MNQDGSLRAYQAPDVEELQRAVQQIVGICVFAFICIVLFILFWAYYHQPVTGITKPTKEVERSENYVPYRKPAKDSSTSSRIEISED